MSLNKDKCYSEKNSLDETRNKEELNHLLMDKYEDTGYKSDCIEDEKSACTHISESIGSKSELYISDNNFTNKKICDFETELNLNISLNKPKVAVLYYDGHSSHTCNNLKVPDFEKPERLTDAYLYLKNNGIFADSHCDLISNMNKVSEDELLRVHSQSYISFIKSYSEKGGGFLGDSTYVTKDTYDVSRMSVGTAIKSAELVIDDGYTYSLALLRPPGHHAGVSRYGGFCIFNNAAILARYLQQKRGIEKIMIVDWDAHAGNGTMDIFYNDPDVITLSVHRDPYDFYPRTGFMSQTGKDEGVGCNINIEMPAGSGNDEYKLAFDELVIPMIKRHSPGFLICCCGFDGYYQEKTVQMNLTSKGYYQMVRSIKSVFPEKFVILMEGGYHKYNGKLCHSIINALLDRSNPINDDLNYTKYEQKIQGQVYNETLKKISKIKHLFSLPEKE